MESAFEHIDTLVAKMLAGEASEAEKAEVETWALQSPSNRAFVNDAIQLFKEAQPVSKQINTEAAWLKINQRIESETKVISLSRTKFNLRIAAAFALIVALSLIIKFGLNTENENSETILAQKSAISKKLSDGSNVRVEKNSELSFQVTPSGERHVILKGEAHFDVIHNEKQDFVIEAEGVLIKDIGTAFTVKAYPESDVVEVKVSSGEVQFYSTSNSGLNLIAGELATYNKKSGQFEKQISISTPKNTNAASRKFIFKNTKLSDAIHQINATYECDITLSNEMIGNCQLSVQFNNQSLDTVIEIIAETLDLTIERQGLKIELQGKGCNNSTQ